MATMTSISLPKYFFDNAQSRGIQVKVLTNEKWCSPTEWYQTNSPAIGVQIIDHVNNVDGVFNCAEFHQVFGEMEMENDRVDRVDSISRTTNRQSSYYDDWSDEELDQRFEALGYES